jgi:hypothetical protein
MGVDAMALHLWAALAGGLMLCIDCPGGFLDGEEEVIYFVIFVLSVTSLNL